VLLHFCLCTEVLCPPRKMENSSFGTDTLLTRSDRLFIYYVLRPLLITVILSNNVHKYNVNLYLTGCAVAQHCCKCDQSFQWESPNFDPRISQTPQFFHTKICTDDYVRHISECAKFGKNLFITNSDRSNKSFSLSACKKRCVQFQCVLHRLDIKSYLFAQLI